jgi:hypothetical protein
MDYRARFYDPYITHLTQPDTIIPDTKNPQAWNRYAYVLNNPIRYNDPSGHLCQDVDMSGHIVSACLPGDDIPNPTGGKPTGVIYDNDQPHYPSLPDPTMPPVIASTDPDCTYSTYVECFYARQRLTIVGDNQVDWQQFVYLMMAVYFDIKQRHRTAGGRMSYDTPFWDGGQQEGRVCFGDDCYGGAEVNYFAQGMWSAANGESMVYGEVMVVDNWKHANSALDFTLRRGDARGTYTFWPSEGTIHWFEIGYTAYRNFDSNSQTLYNLFTP